MPHIAAITIDGDTNIVSTERRFVNLTVTAKINFAEVEKRIGLNYHASIALYDIKDNLDLYAVFPNNHELLLQRDQRGRVDTFVAFSNTSKLSSRTGTAEIKYDFRVLTTAFAGDTMNYAALVVCVPETATAMAWSDIRKVDHIIG